VIDSRKKCGSAAFSDRVPRMCRRRPASWT